MLLVSKQACGHLQCSAIIRRAAGTSGAGLIDPCSQGWQRRRGPTHIASHPAREVLCGGECDSWRIDIRLGGRDERGLGGQVLLPLLVDSGRMTELPPLRAGHTSQTAHDEGDQAPSQPVRSGNIRGRWSRPRHPAIARLLEVAATNRYAARSRTWTKLPCQLWNHTWPLELFTDSIPAIFPSFSKWRV